MMLSFVVRRFEMGQQGALFAFKIFFGLESFSLLSLLQLWLTT
jgi:hypothetical protein